MEARERSGTGRRPAGPDCGDCLTHAGASVSGRPLRCVGAGFPQTDHALVDQG
ncbi:hypothetical protein GCM10023108_20000 [Saccharopolyspora hordei]|uniref:Uncharacterized protein with PIN domain n=1 Tax=Saccharopolyspora hordei TaxID=1838 RepID=A0A853ALK4_9PSEU|nr:uncharacterized protein with PIN domain [Saccharopolyspora hordei]